MRSLGGGDRVSLSKSVWCHIGALFIISESVLAFTYHHFGYNELTGKCMCTVDICSVNNPVCKLMSLTSGYFVVF